MCVVIRIVSDCMKMCGYSLEVSQTRKCVYSLEVSHQSASNEYPNMFSYKSKNMLEFSEKINVDISCELSTWQNDTLQKLQQQIF